MSPYTNLLSPLIFQLFVCKAENCRSVTEIQWTHYLKPSCRTGHVNTHHHSQLLLWLLIKSRTETDFLFLKVCKAILNQHAIFLNKVWLYDSPSPSTPNPHSLCSPLSVISLTDYFSPSWIVCPFAQSLFFLLPNVLTLSCSPSQILRIYPRLSVYAHSCIMGLNLSLIYIFIRVH